MIFHRVAAAEDLADGKGVAVVVAGRPVVLVRDGKAIHALDNLCPHAGARLHQGRVRGGMLSCPMHGARFDLATGACRTPQINDRAIVTHAVRIVGGQVEVSLSSEPMAEPAI